MHRSPEEGAKPFVGREREMTELQAGLAEMLAGRSRLYMLAGEPGIGKTRSCQEFAAIARDQGVRPLWGTCHEGEGAPAYWPWTQILRAYVGSGAVPKRLKETLRRFPHASRLLGGAEPSTAPTLPAGATITACTLRVNVTQRTSPTAGHVHRLCGEHWLDGNGQSEGQATWNSWKTGSVWGVTGAGSTAPCASGGDHTTTGEVAYTPPAGTGFFTFPDFSALCQDAINLRGGWLRLRISQDAEGSQSNLVKFDSSDASTGSNRPKLSVTWFPGP